MSKKKNSSYYPTLEDPHQFFLFSAVAKNRAIKFLILFLIISAVPLTLYLGQQQQDTRQHAAGCGTDCVKISSVTPASVSEANLQDNVVISVNGTGFTGQAGATDPLTVSSVIILNPVSDGQQHYALRLHSNYISSTEIQSTLPQLIDPGAYDIEVLNPDGSSFTLKNGLTVTQ